MTDRRRMWAARAAVALVALAGAYGLYDAIGWPAAVGGLALATVASLPRVAAVVLRVAGAAVVATMALIGFNVLTDALGLDRPPILLGLILAVIVYAAAAYRYLHIGMDLGQALPVAVALAVAFVVGLPIAIGQREPRARNVPKAQPVASKLDVFVVVDRPQRDGEVDFPSDPALAGFDVRYAVGRVEGDEVRWAISGGQDAHVARIAIAGRTTAVDAVPIPRPDADRVLVLVVDGTPPVIEDAAALPNIRGRPREVGRWRRIARASAPPGTPSYALLQTTDRARLERWARFGAVSVQALGSQTLTDAAVRLAIAAPTAGEDLALAMKHRPILLFDREELVPRPLSIESLFAGGKVELCHDARAGGTQCAVVRDPRMLENGGAHLRLTVPGSKQLRAQAVAELEAPAPARRPAHVEGPGAPPPGTPPPSTDPAAAGSRIYVHAVPTERDGRRLLYLDYWWYLPTNPTGAGRGSFCGAGLVIPGVTCFDHQSDWEGITVVVDRTGRRPQPKYVHYAQHDAVVRYAWDELRERWDTPAMEPFTVTVGDSADRPLAFVGKGTHATYPTPCLRSCRQLAHPNVEEGDHDGRLRWAGNDTAACGRSACLASLPTRAGGRLPALWNAFDGVWGERNCVLTYYCDSANPPGAPGTQDRYKEPFRYHGSLKDRVFRRAALEG